MRKLPDFDALTATYPGKGLTAEQVKTQIGGDVNEKDITNTCVVRVSRSLNAAGHGLTATRSLLRPTMQGVSKFHTRLGRDKRWYGLRVTEFWDYMLQTYGKPDVYAKAGSKTPLTRSAFEGPQGIIGFLVPFHDANGHFTLWNGDDLLYGGETAYFTLATEAALWRAGTTWMSKAPV
ncbi:MAG TPA: T6SS effector amidase Tae4 family protein [Pyrinomonadaceae bacterium]|nr:T6SS effector amidase Tae4 family protein [Pyrinomonadaceae bacterium]